MVVCVVVYIGVEFSMVLGVGVVGTEIVGVWVGVFVVVDVELEGP